MIGPIKMLEKHLKEVNSVFNSIDCNHPDYNEINSIKIEYQTAIDVIKKVKYLLKEPKRIKQTKGDVKCNKCRKWFNLKNHKLSSNIFCSAECLKSHRDQVNNRGNKVKEVIFLSN